MISAVTALCLAVVGAIASPARAAGADPAYVSSPSAGMITTFPTVTSGLWWSPQAPFSTSSPLAMAITPTGTTLYATNYNAGTVTPISLSTGTAGTPIAVGTNPSAIAITPDGSKAYVANSGTGTVTAIDLATRSTATIKVGTAPWGVAVTPDGTTAYVVNQYDGTVTPITVATNTAGRAITVGNGANASKPGAIAISPDGSTAYVLDYASNSVVPISVASNTAGAPILGLTAPSGIAITPDGSTAYITEDGTPGHLAPLNLSTRALGRAVTMGTNPYGVAITPDQRTVYVADYNGGNFGAVTPFSLATGTAGWPFPTANGPFSIVISPDQAPVASLTVTPAAAGLSSYFDASSSTVKYGSITSYAWNFGDSHTATTSTPAIAHTYATPGTYTATVTETDSAGTSTTQVFSGQTVSRNGASSARAAQVVQIAPPPVTAPQITLKVPRKLTVRHNRQFVVSIYCPARAVTGCRGTITLAALASELHPRVLATAARCGRGCRTLGNSGTYAARAGHKVAARIHVSADVWRVLRRRKTLRVRLTATNVLGGVPSVSSRTVTLRRA